MGSVPSHDVYENISELLIFSNPKLGAGVIAPIVNIERTSTASTASTASTFNPEAPRKRCGCMTLERRQKDILKNRVDLVRRVNTYEAKMDLIMAHLEHTFTHHCEEDNEDENEFLVLTWKDLNKVLSFGVIALGKLNATLKLYFQEKAKKIGPNSSEYQKEGSTEYQKEGPNSSEYQKEGSSEYQKEGSSEYQKERPNSSEYQKEGPKRKYLEEYERKCHLLLDCVEDIDAKTASYCDMIDIFLDLFGPKPLERVSHWTPVLAKFWGAMVLYLIPVIPGFIFCRMQISPPQTFLYDGFYVAQNKKRRRDLLKKWEIYRGFLGNVALNLSESEAMTKRLATKYLMRHFRGQDGVRPHCIVDQFILLIDQLAMMTKHFAVLIEMVDSAIFYAKKGGKRAYNPVYEMFYIRMGEYFASVIPNMSSLIIATYKKTINDLDEMSLNCLFCQGPIGKLKYFCGMGCANMEDHVYGAYCSPFCREKDEGDHWKICGEHPDIVIKKYKNFFQPMLIKVPKSFKMADNIIETSGTTKEESETSGMARPCH